jgi:YfiH family protein
VKKDSSANTTLYKFEILEPFHEVKHFVAGRNGGFSTGNFKGLNLGFGTEDKPENVLKNRQALSESLGIPLNWFVFPQQTHSANIAIVDNSNLGQGAFNRENAIQNTDALITNLKNIFIVIQVADCVPILLFDKVNCVIAAIHAGWKGTLQEIAKITIAKMKDTFGSNSQDIIAAIGPSIGPCCYEVGSEFKQQFLSKSDQFKICFPERNGKLYFDLWKSNHIQLTNTGVEQQNIEIAEICTYCNHDEFYSSRYGKGITGRFATGIMLQ